jgi:hypothetical protein
MKKRYIAITAVAVSLTGLYALGSNIQKTCVPGNADYEAGTGICNAKNAKADAAEAKAEAKADALWEADLAKRKAAAEAAKNAPKWYYNTFNDTATGKQSKNATVKSENSMNFGFPYSGTQYGTFTVRNHPRFGVDAFLQIDQGQLLCDSYSNTTVLVRFDNGPATRYGCNSAADHSSDIVFIRNVAGLEAGIKNAKKMYVTVSVYQEGSRTWEFNVKGYDRTKV